MRHARRFPTVLAALLLLGAGVAPFLPGSRAGDGGIDLAGWTAAAYRARKFLVATATTRVERAPAPRWCLPSWWGAPRELVRVEIEARLLGGGIGRRMAFSLVGREGTPAGGSRGFLVVVPGRKARAVVPCADGAWWVRTWRVDRAGRLLPPRDRRLPGDAPAAPVRDAWSLLPTRRRSWRRGGESSPSWRGTAWSGSGCATGVSSAAA